MNSHRVRSCLVAVTLAAAIAAPARAADPVPAADPAAAKAEFTAASAELKKFVGDLAVLQAKYHQPGADKAAVEAEFKALVPRGQAAGARLEEAAFTLVRVAPDDREARDICGAVVARALQGDDPTKALAAVEKLAAAKAADGDVMLMGATAAMILSQLDVAADWLAKASAAGLPAARTAELTDAIARERPKVEAEMKARAADATADDLPRVKISTSVGDVVVELFENEAPNTVANFVGLVEKGFYDGTPFHRVIGGFMAQGGDPTGTGTGGPGHAIACECEQPGARQHFLGSLSMAHAGKDTGGSQFFLTFRPTEHLDGKHTVFGRVIEGFDVLAKLARTQDEEGRPVPGVEPDRIVKAEVLRKRSHPYVAKTLPDPRR